MILSMVTTSVFADTTDSITVNVSIVQNGQFVSGTNEAKIAHTPITVTDRNEDGSYDIDEVLYSAHELYYDGGSESGYASEVTPYGLSLTKLWGDDSGTFGYYKNNKSTSSLADIIENGDSLYAFVYQDKTYWSDTYTYFEANTASSEKGQPLSLKLNKLGYDENWATVVLPVENATITIDGNDTEYKTNSEGIVEITFENAGSFVISAKSDYTIAPPISIITVTENSGTETTPPTDEKEDTETPDTPPTKEKIDYNVVGNTILENIAGTYKDTVSDWIAFPEWYVMDMGAYEIYNPETENKLSSTAKQDYVNYAVKAINTATKDTDIDKAVLGLVAINKNPELLYSVNSNTPISAIEKLNGVSKSTSVWAAPYTLAVYNQGDYKADTYETELVNALLTCQSEDGSFNESNTVIDTTANAICGLSFYNDKPEVNSAIQKALNFLSTQQSDTGDFGGNSNSTAMAIIGLCAAGVDLENDARFIKNGNNIIDGLLSFALADNSGFGYTNNSDKNANATEQAFRALIAVMQTIKTGKAFNIYDFSCNELTPARETGSTSSSSPSIPSEPSDNNITVTVTIKADTDYWLNNYKVKIPSDDATAYDAFAKACDANSITHKGAASGYVSSMTKGNKTLAEFDNENNSGWLYKVNGELPIVGLTDCKISDGDKLVWYYTEDWTKDPSSGHYGGGISRPVKKDEDKNIENKDEQKEEFKPTTDIKQYTDVKTDDWYYDDVKKAVEIGLFNGISENSFAPNRGMTRGMLACVLYRYDGEKGFSKKQEFADCKDNEWYSEAVYWASENNIISGYGNGVFGTDDMVTRQQLVTILYRYAGTKTEADLSEFADNHEIEDWAKDAFAWAVNNKIIFGTDSKELNPNGYATRAEMSAILMRYINTLAE